MCIIIGECNKVLGKPGLGVLLVSANLTIQQSNKGEAKENPKEAE